MVNGQRLCIPTSQFEPVLVLSSQMVRCRLSGVPAELLLPENGLQHHLPRRRRGTAAFKKFTSSRIICFGGGGEGAVDAKRTVDLLWEGVCLGSGFGLLFSFVTLSESCR